MATARAFSKATHWLENPFDASFQEKRRRS